ncbi:MAG: hypothetical protein QOE72_1364 [Chloroflexota bacterium]|jgi:hypothetical protein|nr:hypothetical protein [Chloroflexota bacterium]
MTRERISDTRPAAACLFVPGVVTRVMNSTAVEGFPHISP